MSGTRNMRGMRDMRGMKGMRGMRGMRGTCKGKLGGNIAPPPYQVIHYTGRDIIYPVLTSVTHTVQYLDYCLLFCCVHKGPLGQRLLLILAE